jgi:hypothetical protein
MSIPHMSRDTCPPRILNVMFRIAVSIFIHYLPTFNPSMTASLYDIPSYSSVGDTLTWKSTSKLSQARQGTDTQTIMYSDKLELLYAIFHNRRGETCTEVLSLLGGGGIMWQTCLSRSTYALEMYYTNQRKQSLSLFVGRLY